MREDFSLSWRMVWYPLLAAVVIGAISIGGYMLMPVMFGLERKATVSSHQYIEGKRGLLLGLAGEYMANTADLARYKEDAAKHADVIHSLTMQQESLLDRMRQESALIPDNEVPASVQHILLTKGR